MTASPQHENREELGRLRIARIRADTVAIPGQLREVCPALYVVTGQSLDLTMDRIPKHGCVDVLDGRDHAAVCGHWVHFP